MDILADLKKEKSKILSKISRAAEVGKTDLLLLESEKLKRVEFLMNNYTQIAAELRELQADKPNLQTISNSTQFTIRQNDEMRLSTAASSRELGHEIRKKFLKKLEGKGIHLGLIKGKTLYRTKSGKRAGIAVATERQPNRWFLGLPDGSFDHAVLLCQSENRDIIEVLLPDRFFQDHGEAMSRSKGQLKFNVVKRDRDVLILVPGTDGVSASAYPSNYDFLL